MTDLESSPRTRRRRPMPFTAEVTDIEERSPHLLRVYLRGESLVGFQWPGPASHLKLFVPDPGQRAVVLPQADQDGMLLLGHGQARPLTRTFTPRSFDAERRELALEFVLHGQGAASEWVSTARVGDLVAVSQPRASYAVDPESAWLLLLGDETAVPAISTILEALPPTTKASVALEILDDSHRMELTAGATEVRWLTSTPRDPGHVLEGAVREWSVPQGLGQVWAACESTAVRRIRQQLVENKGLGRDRITTRGYWRLGQSNHPDHDFGDHPDH